jgi:hypothetical protein
MHRESVYLCTLVAGDEEQEAHVRAWDAREAAELFAREVELDSGSSVAVEEIQVRLVLRTGGGGPSDAVAA